jgi:hypothetical protein
VKCGQKGDAVYQTNPELLPMIRTWQPFEIERYERFALGLLKTDSESRPQDTTVFWQGLQAANA